MNELAVTTGDGRRLAYRFDGTADKPVLLLSNSIGTDLTMWDPQIEALGKHLRVLRYDSRGHGASDVPPGPYSVDRLGRDAIASIRVDSRFLQTTVAKRSVLVDG